MLVNINVTGVFILNSIPIFLNMGIDLKMNNNYSPGISLTTKDLIYLSFVLQVHFTS